MANKHLVFLIHGMGVHGDGWSAGMQDAIRAAFKSLPKFSGLEFDKLFEFVPLNYDRHFNELRQQWAAQAKKLTDFLNPLAEVGDLGATGKLITKLADASDAFNKEDFARTHLLDVFLYRFAANSRHTVRTRVASEILDRLNKQDKLSEIRWSVVAHSLGTSVAHDVLHEMFSAANKGKLTLGQLTYPRALVMLSNVSRVLESDIDVYTSLVAPGAPAAPSRFGVRRYVNAFHEFDPIAVVTPFEPVSTWPAPAVREEGLYTNVPISDIEDFNVHAAEHHIRNPKVHVPMFNALFDAVILRKAELDAAYDRYRALLPVNKMNQLIDELKQYKPQMGDDPIEILKKWRDFLDEVEKRLQ